MRQITLKPSSLKQLSFSISQFLCGSAIERTLIECLWLKASHEAAAKLVAGVGVSCKGLSDECSVSKLPQVAVCRTQFLWLLAPPQLLTVWTYTGQLITGSWLSPEQVRKRITQTEATHFFVTQHQRWYSITFTVFYETQVSKSSPHSRGVHHTRVGVPGSKGLTGGHLRGCLPQLLKAKD